MDTFLLILSLLVLFTVLRPVTTALHELGHALPALLFTSGSVSVFIGVPDKSPGPPLFTWRRLRVWITRDPLKWLGGFCSHEATAHRWQTVLILLGGVLFSMAIAIMAAFLAFRSEVHGFILLLFVLVAVSTVLDVFINLVPSAAPVPMPDGHITFNDGEQLRRLFFSHDLNREAGLAVEHSQAGRHEEALVYYERFLRMGWTDGAIYFNAIVALHQLGRKEEALAMHRRWASEQEINSKGIALGALILSVNGHELEAIAEYDKALAIDPDDAWALNNKGYTLNKLERYAEAIDLFDRAITFAESKAYALNNRGLARLKLGDTATGLADIEEGLRLDPENSYGYRNLGVHHLDEGRAAEALPLFQKAKAMDANTDGIDALIEQARKAGA